MADVRCLNCAKFSFDRAGEEWKRKGVGCCELRIQAVKFNPARDRECSYFTPAEARVIELRTRWMQEVQREQAAQEKLRRWPAAEARS